METEATSRTAIAGTGAIARAFGHLLHKAGEPAAFILSRDAARARSAADAIGGGIRAATYATLPRHLSQLIIAVPDMAIAQVASAVSACSELRVALHTSGNTGLEALDVLAKRGVSCGSIHPLQTVTLRSKSALDGAAFTVWGEGLAAVWAQRLATAAGGETLRISPAHKSIYHAAAVMASNHVLALLDSSEWLMAAADVSTRSARHALGILMKTAVEGGLREGPMAALTGPIARGDVETVQEHLEALATAPSDIRLLYRAASTRTLDLARRKGLNAEAADRLQAVLSES